MFCNNRELKQPRQRRWQKLHLKSEFALFETSTPTVVSSKLSNVGDFFGCLILKHCIEVHCSLVFTSSIKLEITKFLAHVVVVQQW